MENFWRFAQPEALFYLMFCKKLKIFGASRLLKYFMKIFIGTGVKKQGRNWHILVSGGGKKLELFARSTLIVPQLSFLFLLMIFFFLCLCPFAGSSLDNACPFVFHFCPLLYFCIDFSKYRKIPNLSTLRMKAPPSGI